jgi:hypothetical protein
MGVAYNTNIVRDGLVFYLDTANKKSYSGTGTTTIDVARNLSGTLTNGASVSGGAVVLDGTNDYVDFGSASTFTVLDLVNKSFQVWIKRNATTGSGIIDKDFDAGAGNYGGWGFWIQSNNKLWFWNHANLDLLDDGPNSVVNGVWTNVAVTYNYSTFTANFYINGVLNSTKTNVSIVEKASTSANLNVGATRNGVSTLNASIGTVMAYNKVLSAEEIRTNFNAVRGRYNV